MSLRFCLSYLFFLFSPSCAVSPVSFSGLCLQPNSVYFIVPLNQALWSPRDAATFQTALGMFPLSSSCKPIEPCSSPWAYHNLELAGISYLFNEIGIPHNIILHIHLPFHSVTLFFHLSSHRHRFQWSRSPVGHKESTWPLLFLKDLIVII